MRIESSSLERVRDPAAVRRYGLRGPVSLSASMRPAASSLAIAGLIVTFVDAAVSANLYSAREWEELDEEPIRERRPRRRAASR